MAGQHAPWRTGLRIDGRFDLGEQLAHTGSASIWRGSDAKHDAPVVLVQHPPADPEIAAARRREAQRASTVSGACWLRVLGFGEYAGQSYLVAENTAGLQPLEERLRRRQRMPASQIAAIATQILAAIELAQDAGVVHGDVCAGSVFCSDDDKGQVKLLFLGLAHAPDHADSILPLPHMSPEQVRGEPLDHTTDLWGLGVLMYRMAYGSFPFQPSAASNLRAAILEHPLECPDRLMSPRGGQHLLPPTLVAVIARALQRNPELRFPSPIDMRNDLKHLGPAPPASPRQPASSSCTRSPSPAAGTLSPKAWRSAARVTPATTSTRTTDQGLSAPVMAADNNVTNTAGMLAVPSPRLGIAQESLARRAVTRKDHPADTHSPHVGQQPAMPRTPRRATVAGVLCTPTFAEGGAGAAPGAVGLVVTREVPHLVTQVADLCDANGLVQGDEGYANPVVMPGDRLLAIDGVPVEWLAISEVHALLRGPVGTPLVVEVGRADRAFAIVVQRHLPHKGRQVTPRDQPSHLPMQLSSAETVSLLTEARSQSCRPGHSGKEGPVVPPERTGDRQRSEGAALQCVRVCPGADQDDKAVFRSISDAVCLVAAGGVVQVAAGTYDEEVVVDRGIHICAEPSATVMLRGHGEEAVVRCVGAGGTLSGVTVTQSGGDKSKRGRQTVRAVHVLAGSLTLRDCTLRSEYGVGVMVVDAGRALLLRCQLRGCGKSGLLVAEGGRVSCEQCEINDNHMYGLVCQSGGEAAVHRTHLSKNRLVGVLVYRPRTSCTLVDVDVSDNGEMGIAVQDGAQVKIQASRVARNLHAALYADGPSARATAGHTDLVDSGIRGIGVQGGACIEVRSCLVARNAQEGLFVSGHGSCGLLEDCTVADNGSKGVGMQSGGFVLARGNRVRSNKEGGVFASDAGSLATIQQNAIENNGMRGIGVQHGATAEIEGNTVARNALEGIYVSRPGSRALVVRNKLLGNGVKGLGVHYGADVSVEENTIADNAVAGVHVDGHASRATLRANSFSGNRAAVIAEEGSFTRLMDHSATDPASSFDDDATASTLPNAATTNTRRKFEGRRAVSDAPALSPHSGVDGAEHQLAAHEEGNSVQECLRNAQVAESTRQATPRTQTCYPTLMTPRGHSSSQVRAEALTPRRLHAPAMPQGERSLTGAVLDRLNSPLQGRGAGSETSAAGDAAVIPGCAAVGQATVDIGSDATSLEPLPQVPSQEAVDPDVARAHPGEGAALRARLTSPAAAKERQRQQTQAIRGRLASPAAPLRAADSSTAPSATSAVPRAAAAEAGATSPSAATASSCRTKPVVPVLKLERVMPTAAGEPPMRVWRAEVEGLAARNNLPPGGHAQDDMVTPRGGRRSDHGLLLVAGADGTRAAQEVSVAAANASARQSPRLPEQALLESAAANEAVNPPVDVLGSETLSPIGEEGCLAWEPPTRGSDGQRAGGTMPRTEGDVAEGNAHAPGAHRELGKQDLEQAKPVPSLSLDRVAPSLQLPGSCHASPGPAGQIGDEDAPPSMREWMMMPTYMNTPRTTRSTFDDNPHAGAGWTGSGGAKPRNPLVAGLTRSGTDALRPSHACTEDAAVDEAESTTVLPLRDEVVQGKAQSIWSQDWHTHVHDTLALLSPRFR